MSTFNNATIEGFVTNDAVHKVTRSGKSLLTCELAITHYSKPGEPPRVSFLSCEAWYDLADKFKDELVKGKKVMISGVLRQDRWENEKGKLESRLKIIANEIEIRRIQV